MSKGTIVIVARDMGAESVTRPIAEKARENGYDLGIVVEGLAGPRFVRAGFIPEFMGTEKFFEMPFTFDAKTYLQKRFGKDRPGVLVVGESGPTNLEELLAITAQGLNAVREHKISIVVCQDYWGGAGIMMPNARPHRVCTNDEYSKELVLCAYTYMNDGDVRIVGNPGVKKVKVSDKTLNTYEDLKKRFEKIFFFAGGGKGHTEEELELLKQCLELTSGEWVLIAGYHPNVVKTHGDIWRAIVKPLGDRVVESEAGTGDEWATLADMTLSGTSTCMTTAVYAGNIAVVLWSEAGKEIFKSSNIEMTPIAKLGCAEVVYPGKPVNLRDLKGPSEENLAKLKPHDPEVAWQAVKELLDK